MVLDISHHSGVVEESMDRFLAVATMLHIPQHHGFVIGAGCNHSGVKRKLRASDPVLMTSEALDKFLLLYIPDFHEFVITGGDKQ